MPWILISHKAFFQSAFLQVAYKVPVSAAALLQPTSPSDGSARSVFEVRHSIAWRWVVSRARLQANGLGRIEVASNPLNRSRDSALLIHCRGPLPTASHPSLWGVDAGLGEAAILRLWGRLCHHYLTILTSTTGHRLGPIGGRHGPMTRRRGKYGAATIDWQWLRMPGLGKRHRCRSNIWSLRCRVGLGLSCLGTLLAQSLSLLLLLCSRSRRSIERARLEVHRRHEGSHIFLLSNKGVKFGLLR